jgi:hypothetical protein
MSEDRLRAFMAAYNTALEKAVTEHPDEHGYPVSGVPAVVQNDSSWPQPVAPG